MTCKHENGDMIAGRWVCGQCWKRIEGPLTIKPMPDGTILREFVGEATAAVRKVCGPDISETVKECILSFVLAEMEVTGIEFGDPGHDWKGKPVGIWARRIVLDAIDAAERS